MRTLVIGVGNPRVGRAESDEGLDVAPILILGALHISPTDQPAHAVSDKNHLLGFGHLLDVCYLVFEALGIFLQ